MSKVEKPRKMSDSLQLKKDINITAKDLQVLGAKFENISAIIEDSEAVANREKSFKNKISSLESENVDLRRKIDEDTRKHKEELDKFTDVTKSIAKTSESRSSQYEQRLEAKIKDIQKLYATEDLKRLTKVKALETQLVDLQGARNKVELKMKAKLEEKTSELQATKMKAIKENQILENKLQIASQEKQDLRREIDDQGTILRGRNLEIDKIDKRLKALETFADDDSPARLNSFLEEIQWNLRELCMHCADSAQLLPGWMQLDGRLSFERFPRFLLIEKETGRYLLTAAIQNSLCTTMESDIFVPFCGLLSCNTRALNDAVYADNPAHEAIWRLLTVRAVLKNKSLQIAIQKKLDKAAEKLVKSWLLFPTENQKEISSLIATFLMDTALKWLKLMEVRGRYMATIEVKSEQFDYDSNEKPVESAEAADKNLQPRVPVLCLFPAVLLYDSMNSTQPPQLLRKGTAMFTDSRSLVTGLAEERDMRSRRRSSSLKQPRFQNQGGNA